MAKLCALKQSCFELQGQLYSPWKDSISKVNLQGQLHNGAGIAVDGTYGLTVRLFTQETGGVEVFNEGFSAVNVQNGVFSIALGEKQPLAKAIVDNAAATLWVEIKVDSEVPLPRQRLGSAPRAILADGLSCSNCITAEQTTCGFRWSASVVPADRMRWATWSQVLSPMDFQSCCRSSTRRAPSPSCFPSSGRERISTTPPARYFTDAWRGSKRPGPVPWFGSGRA